MIKKQNDTKYLDGISLSLTTNCNNPSMFFLRTYTLAVYIYVMFLEYRFARVLS